LFLTHFTASWLKLIVLLKTDQISLYAKTTVEWWGTRRSPPFVFGNDWKYDL